LKYQRGVFVKRDYQKRGFDSSSPLFASSEIKLFAQAIPGVVTSLITPLEAGRAMVQGQSWRSQLYSPTCQTTLLPQQFIQAIGRENNTLLVIPLHCLLWDRYIDEFWSVLTEAEIAILRSHERHWRKP
jgi:hypothetical protein